MAAKLDETTSSQTSVQRAFNVPVGHILVADKWRGSDLVSTLQSSVNILYEDKLGVVDFHPSSQTGVLYITQAEVVANAAYKRRIAKLRKVNHVKGIVLLEKTEKTKANFSKMQEFITLQMGLLLIPVSSDTEAGRILGQMVLSENNPNNNIFRKIRKAPPTNVALLATVQTLPKLGEVKAKALLNKFESLHGIANASLVDLSEVIGRAHAKSVHQFFHTPNR